MWARAHFWTPSLCRGEVGRGWEWGREGEREWEREGGGRGRIRRVIYTERNGGNMYVDSYVKSP